NAGQNRLYLNNGQGTFTDATAARLPIRSDNTTSVAIGDVDGDRDLDLVFGTAARPFGERNRLYLNDGGGTVLDATAARMPGRLDDPQSVAIGDVDEDGDVDLLFGNWGQQNSLYLNLQRQLDAPIPLRVGHAYQLDAYARYGPGGTMTVALPFLSSG